MTQEQKSAVNLFTLFFGIGAYSCTSIGIVYFNHWLFTKGFKYPVYISWLQQVVGFILFLVGHKLGLIYSPMEKIFPAEKINFNTAKNVCLLSSTFVLTIAFSNVCLKYCLISTYLVARSLTLLFVLVLSYLILNKVESPIVVFACFTMAFGFLVNSFDPSTLSIKSFTFGAISSCFQALYNVMIKFSLKHVDNDNQKLLYYNVFLSSFLFLPVVLAFEGFEPFFVAIQSKDRYLTIWGGIFVSGLLGTTLNMTQYMIMRITNPVATNIIGLTKSILQTMGGFIIYNEHFTFNSLAGIGLSTLGSLIYSVKKSLDHIELKKNMEKENEIINSSEKIESKV